MDDLLLIGPPGTNKVMAGELSRLVRRALDRVRLPAPAKLGPGGLRYPWDAEVARVARTYHRTCARVLRAVAASRAGRLEPLYADVAAQVPPPGSWYRDGDAISVAVRNVGAFAAGPRQIVGAVKNAIVDAAAAHGARLRVDPDAPDVSIQVRMHGEDVFVCVDLGGPMHRRGWRAAAGEAPLRENLAAALVMLARHDGRREPLVDPMAGAGTIAIEAALMARGAPVRAGDPAPPLFGDTRPVVVANELDRGVADRARRNARAAGVADTVRVRCGDFRRLSPADLPDGPGLVLCNPPYGRRLAGDAAALYADFAAWLRQLRGWRAGVLVANPAFERAMRIRPRVKKPLSARPLSGYFYLYEL